MLQINPHNMSLWVSKNNASQSITAMNGVDFRTTGKNVTRLKIRTDFAEVCLSLCVRICKVTMCMLLKHSERAKLKLCDT